MSGVVKQRIMPAGHWDWPLAVTLSQGWKVGPWVYVGGQVSQDEHGVVLHPFDIHAQVDVVYANIAAVLAEVGGTLADLVQMTTYYVYDGPPEGADEFYKAMTRSRLKHLADPGPVGTAVRVAGLALHGLVVEVDAVAYVEA